MPAASVAAVTKRGMGRPRSRGPSTSGLSTEQDILHAAATLFCKVGYGSTSTYAIAKAAGISQASLYHYFGGKHAILLALLLRTVEPSVALSTRLLGRDEPADTRLWALCADDVRLLVSGDQNTGSLYLLPELSDDRFAAFHAERARLADVYATLVAGVLGREGSGIPDESWLVLGLVESVILRRRTGSIGSDVAVQIADAALRILGVPEARLAIVHREADDLLAQLS